MSYTPMHIRTFLLALVACVAAGGSGCASSHPVVAAPSPQVISAADARAVTVLRTDGKVMTWEELVAAAAGADAVLVGENHGHPLGLAAAAALWEDMLPTSPNAALAMEFIERDEQSRLDDYLTGINDEATFRKRTNRTDSNFPPGHRAMIEAAKNAHRPVFAANAPRMYARIARLESYERLAALTPEQKRLLRIPDSLPQPGSRYRDDFDKVMTGEADHAPGAAAPDAAAERRAKLDAAFRSQSVWDWTMAESVARAIEQGNAPVLLVVGRFHVDFEGGTPQALAKLRPATHTLLVSFVDQDAPMVNGAPTIRGEDRGRADYVVYVGTAR